MKRVPASSIKKFLSITLLTFLTLCLVSFGLPALLLILNVPSFEVGEGVLWLLRWQNTAEGSGITVNLLPLLVAAILIGLVSLGLRRGRSYPDSREDLP